MSVQTIQENLVFYKLFNSQLAQLKRDLVLESEEIAQAIVSLLRLMLHPFCIFLYVNLKH